MSLLGEYVREKRNEKGYSLRECAKLCNMSHTRIDVIEKGMDTSTGKKPEVTTDTLIKLAKGLNIDVLKLISLNMADKGIDIDFSRLALETIGQHEDAKLFENSSEVMKQVNTLKKARPVIADELSEPYNEMIRLLKQLSPEQIQWVLDFVAGLLANR